MKISHLFIILFLFVNHVSSYGYVGHEITASIAQRFLTPKTRENLRELLPKEANGNLVLFTSRMHYASSPHDNPPDHCFITYTPAKVDLLKAIHNYTNRLDPKNNLDFLFRAEALKFLVHFIGDLHQPLHVSRKLKGGNGARGIFEGHKTSLHYIWDSRLINKHIRELNEYNFTFSGEENLIKNNFYGEPFYEPYVKHILELMKTIWRQEIAEWPVCNEGVEYTFEKETQDILKSNSLLFGNKQTYFGLNSQQEKENYSLKKQPPSASCPEFWAIPINKLNCQVVWKDYKPDTELSEGIYYERIKRTRIVEKLLAIAGIRIAAVLNSLLG
ncbi:S1/P1 nuclease [Glomus cerebriforme]|uniref:S1/P1 nuclease n=1 Tax=Glomus cerebriforme TaxID=658196 RepID=A0A397SX93_9GLOM|nr:S1/P1 nuclease [Glomus cerebriforme]